MYGNTPFQEKIGWSELTTDERKVLREELSRVADRTREYLPGEFVVGSEITRGTDGPRATVAVQPPVGTVVSTDYPPGDRPMSSEELDDIATDLAASAALQVKEAMHDDRSPTAR